MSGPDYSNKSDAQIINEQAASLNAKSDSRNKAQFDTGRTEMSDTTGVNETGLDEFPGATVEITNNSRIPVEQGGAPRTEGSRPSAFESHVPAGEDEQSWKMKTQPGSINVSGRREEALRSVDAPADEQPQLGEQ
ncbi:hypothetical protein JCM11251_000867 [Rhodosporidiobolus azoricus]